MRPLASPPPPPTNPTNEPQPLPRNVRLQFWQRECSEWKSCPGAKAAQNGTHDYQVYVETPGLEVAKVHDRCLVPLRRVYNEWTNKWSENVQYQNLWCSWLMAVAQEELNGRPFDFVARVRTDVYVVWEKTWFTHLDDRTIAGAADTLQENRVAKLTKNDCYVSNKFLTSCVTDVFFMGRRAPFETLLSATRNVTMMYERHMTWAAGVHGLYFTPVVAGSNKASCPQCKMNLFIRDGNIFCILDNAAPPSSRTATHGIDAAVMTCKAVGPTANWANRQIVPYHGTAVGPHDHFRVRPEDYGT